MNRRNFLLANLIAAAAGLPRSLAAGPENVSRLGVSLAGPEFGADKLEFSNRQPGRFGQDYTYNSERTTRYFCEQGLKLLRVPFRWERLQPRLGEELNKEELERLRIAIGWVKKHAGEVILDVHNEGRYSLDQDGKVRAWIIDQSLDGKTPVRREHYSDLWRRLAEVFRDEPAVAAYGLMNEPHDMGTSDWKTISQAAVDGIRKIDAKKLILVPGDDWSSAERFCRANGPTAWIKDPAGNIAYEAHCYFDRDGSGKYAKDFKTELADDPKLEGRGVERLAPFVGWCQVNGVRGFLGEFGVPADPGWLKVLDHFLAALVHTGFDGCWWAAGEWWKDYPLSLQPTDDYRKPAPQMARLLEKGRGK